MSDVETKTWETMYAGAVSRAAIRKLGLPSSRAPAKESPTPPKARQPEKPKRRVIAEERK